MFRQSYDRAPCHFESINNLAYTLWALGRYDEADSLYLQGRKRFPEIEILRDNHFHLLVKWGDNLAKQNQREEAKKQYMRALNIMPGHERTLKKIRVLEGSPK